MLWRMQQLHAGSPPKGLSVPSPKRPGEAYPTGWPIRAWPMNSLARLGIWAWSVSWLGYGAAAVGAGQALGAGVAVACISGAIAADELLVRRGDSSSKVRERRRSSPSHVGTVSDFGAG
jgi:hypothetical protein